jgi:hypothetical protein
MHPLLLLGLVLVVLWILAVAAFKVVGFAIHLLLVVAVVMIVWGLVKRGARKVGIGGDDGTRRPS